MSLAGRPRDDVSDVQARPAAGASPSAPASSTGPVPLEPLTAGTAQAQRQRASVAFMRQHPAHWIALGFGSGLSPIAPGTAGTLWAWLAWTVLALWLTPAQQGWLLVATLPIGWWATRVTARNLGVADPSAIVIDEVLAFWAVLWLLLPASGWTQLLAFALFRFFDARKPGPVGWADRALHGGGWRGAAGVMLDDVVAAACTLLVLALWLRLAG